MNNKLLNTIMFATGAAIGSVVTWKILKTKYEQITQEEIDSVKYEYGRLARLMQNDNEKVFRDEECDESTEYEHTREFSENDKEMTEYYKLSDNYRSSDDERKNNEEGDMGDEDEVPYVNGPYVISPDDFNNNPPGFNAQALDYFADDVLADGWGVILDIDETIGEDAVNHFGEYVDDIVYVRNERTELDYEVTRDPRTYEEAVINKPYIP